jgi:bifunctional DNA-binding transcriptional regulator/antitoxin component of YhaV-PrlF toxin-antitoxin module
METTKVVVAQPKSKSLRTTIPVGITRQFGIGAGSELAWEIEARDNKLIIVVHPIVMRASADELGALRPRGTRRKQPKA